MTSPVLERAEQMARDGKTIVQISAELDVDWSEVAGHIRSLDVRSWQGAKQLITRRLNRLKTEPDEAAREQLAVEADKWIDYLYYEAKRLSRQIDQARRAMDRARRTLDP